MKNIIPLLLGFLLTITGCLKEESANKDSRPTRPSVCYYTQIVEIPDSMQKQMNTEVQQCITMLNTFNEIYDYTALFSVPINATVQTVDTTKQYQWISGSNTIDFVYGKSATQTNWVISYIDTLLVKRKVIDAEEISTKKWGKLQVYNYSIAANSMLKRWTWSKSTKTVSYVYDDFSTTLKINYILSMSNDGSVTFDLHYGTIKSWAGSWNSKGNGVVYTYQGDSTYVAKF